MSEWGWCFLIAGSLIVLGELGEVAKKITLLEERVENQAEEIANLRELLGE